MASAVDLYFLEQELAKKSTSDIKQALKSAIGATTHSTKTITSSTGKQYSYENTGQAQKLAGSRAVYKDKRLQRITIQAPHYIFKQNYGFEGTKSNGINMRLQATDVLSKTLDNSHVLEYLADGISEIRLSQVTSIINFTKNGR